MCMKTKECIGLYSVFIFAWVLRAVPLGALPQRPADTFVFERTLKLPVQPVWGMAFGGARATLAAVGNDDAVRIWDAASGNLLSTLKLDGHPQEVSCLDFSRDGKWIVVGEGFVTAGVMYTAKIELLDVAAHQDARALATHHWEIVKVAFSDDGRLLANCGWDRKVRVLELPSGRQLNEFEYPGKPLALALSPDARLVAAGGEDSSVAVWDRLAGKELPPLTGAGKGILGLAFSPDGLHLAAAAGDGSARLWSVATGEALATLSGHVGAVLAISYSPDGKHLATGGADGTLRVWDAGTAQNLESLGSHSAVWQVAISPDGHYLAAGHADGTIGIYVRRN